MRNESKAFFGNYSEQKVGQHPYKCNDNDDMEQWDAVITGNDELLEKYMSGKPFKMSELEQGRK